MTEYVNVAVPVNDPVFHVNVEPTTAPEPYDVTIGPNAAWFNTPERSSVTTVFAGITPPV